MDREQSVQHFLDLLKKSRRGNFKIYIGMIAGVGKSHYPFGFIKISKFSIREYSCFRSCFLKLKTYRRKLV